MAQINPSEGNPTKIYSSHPMNKNVVNLKMHAITENALSAVILNRQNFRQIIITDIFYVYVQMNDRCDRRHIL